MSHFRRKSEVIWLFIISDTTNKPILLKQHGKSFHEENFQKINKTLSYLEKCRTFIKRSYILNHVVKYLDTHDMLPAICFVFSRKNVETCAREIGIGLFNKGSTIPNTIAQECRQILMKLPNAKEYFQLPEFTSLMQLFQKGVAIHHAGMMPVFREMVEILFGKGYIKLLFATETFAVGINMPAKTVIFSDVQKYDGNGFRYLLSHEYTQMAGRAGRRGIDTVGYVIHLNNMFEIPTYAEYAHILNGRSQNLVSKFKIHYNLILNLISINKFNFEEFMHRSMIKDEIDKDQKQIEDKLASMNTLLNSKKQQLQFLKTPMDIIQNYIENQKIKPMSKNKMRKKIMRDIGMADRKL